MIADISSMGSFVALMCKCIKACGQGMTMPKPRPDFDKTGYNGPIELSQTSKKDLMKQVSKYRVSDTAATSNGLTSLCQSPSPIKSTMYLITESATRSIKQE